MVDNDDPACDIRAHPLADALQGACMRTWTWRRCGQWTGCCGVGARCWRSCRPPGGCATISPTPGWPRRRATSSGGCACCCVRSCLQNMNVHPPRRRRFCALRWHRQTASVVPCHRRRRHPRAASVRAADAASGHVALLNNPAAGHNPEVVSVPPLRAVLLGAHDAGVPARHHRGGLLQRGHRARHRCHPPAATRPWLATFRAACCCMLGPFNVHTLRSHSLAPLEAPIPVL